jgi:ubiquinone/menaquinone biosynthesis C-methylase UbiE
MLDPEAVRAFYDRFGVRQDRQAFYEDAALESLSDHSDFAAASAIAEFGCGTGRFAHRILAASPAASYVGFDVSTTMLGLARQRLQPFGARSRVEQLEPGTVTLPLAAGSVDRLVSTYVLDLLPEPQIAEFLREAQRVLTPSGRLCVASLTVGRGLIPGVLSRLWTLVYRVRPDAVGGCRPIQLGPACDAQAWQRLHHERVVRWGVTSEVLVAAPLRSAPATDGRARLASD